MKGTKDCIHSKGKSSQSNEAKGGTFIMGEERGGRDRRQMKTTRREE